MSYFIKKSKNNKGTYLQIYEGHYDVITGKVKQKSYKPLGYLEDYIGQGIEDPIAFFTDEVNALNVKQKEEKYKNRFDSIKDTNKRKNIGYFPLKSLLSILKVQPIIDLYKVNTNFQFDLFEMMSALIFARVVKPCSKKKSIEEIIPTFFGNYNFSYDQVLAACEYFGMQYEKFIDIFLMQTKKAFKIKTDVAYFDCTNFYFEIDRQDDFRRKGPSKENRTDPIIGMGLLLDGNMIPVGMKMYPGNESEKPYLRKMIGELKDKSKMKGKTIQVADKGLNCAKNIQEALLNGDGYIFSKSVKSLSEKEKMWVFNSHDDSWVESYYEDGSVRYKYKECIDVFTYETINEIGEKETFQVKEKRVVTHSAKLQKKQRAELDRMFEKTQKCCLSQAKQSEYGSYGKFITFADEDGKKSRPIVNTEAFRKAYSYCGYNMLVTSEVAMKGNEISSVYRDLWRIEESFRLMKSDLDARPVYLQKENCIKGHFLICYLATLLIRLLQFYILDNRYSSSEIVSFINDFLVIEYNKDSEYINVGKYSKLYDELSAKYGVILHKAYLNSNDIKRLKL